LAAENAQKINSQSTIDMMDATFTSNNSSTSIDGNHVTTVIEEGMDTTL
jgi:hypothetical protein